jgi:hypothetical protein
MKVPAPLLAIGVFALLFVLERFFPLRKSTRSLLARFSVNVAISAPPLSASPVGSSPAPARQ